MEKILPPLCLFFALVTLIAGFAMLAMGSPEVGMDLHRARLGSDEQLRELLESRLRRRKRRHIFVLAGLFSSSVLFTAAAFLAMRRPGAPMQR